MWAASSTLRVGSLHIGVRSTAPAVDALVRRAFATHLVEGIDSPANYSVAILDADVTQATRPLHLLFRSTCPVLRSPSPVAVLTALASYMSSHHDEAAEGLLKLRGVALVAGTEAVLVPEILRRTVAVSERRLNCGGLRVVDESFVRLDAATGELVVLPPSVEPDPEVLAELGRSYPVGERGARPSTAGRYRVTRWLLAQVPGDAGPMSPAAVVPYLLPLVANRDEIGRARAVTGLAAVLRHVAPVNVSGLETDEVLRCLGEMRART